MLRSLVRPRPASLPAIVRLNSRAPSNVPSTSRPFHSTPAALKIGYKNFKNAPRLKWRVQQELDKKDTEIQAEMPQRLPYKKALKANRKEAWLGARKKIDHSRLFGTVGGGVPFQYFGDDDWPEEGKESA